MRNVLDNLVEKIKRHILCSIPFFRKSCSLWDNVEKYVGDRGAPMTSKYGAYALRAGLARLHAHAHAHALGYPTQAHARVNTDQYVILLFHSNNGYANAPQWYVICTFPLLLGFLTVCGLGCLTTTFRHSFSAQSSKVCCHDKDH
jgi:hypothetical protein